MRRILAVCAFGLAVAAPAKAGLAACLPGNLVGALSKAYPEWKVVELGDLVSDDQAILRRAHKDQCPGVVRGSFDGKIDAYAVTLKTRKAGLRQILVVVTPSPNGEAKISKVDSGSEQVDVLSVVSRVPPGVIETTGGLKFRIEHDGIGGEALEAGMLIYYFDGSQYRSAQVGD